MHGRVHACSVSVLFRSRKETALLGFNQMENSFLGDFILHSRDSEGVGISR